MKAEFAQPYAGPITHNNVRFNTGANVNGSIMLAPTNRSAGALVQRDGKGVELLNVVRDDDTIFFFFFFNFFIFLKRDKVY